MSIPSPFFVTYCCLPDSRKGISLNTGIMLYKSLVRPHLEFSAAACRECMKENSIQTLERVQSRCLRTILGTKAHASGEGVDVISNVTPVRLRLQHMCTLEYARIMQKADNNRLRNMLDGSILIGNTFSPMSYIKHQAKLLHLNSENITIASEHITTISEILEDVKLSQIDVAGEDGAAYTKPDDRESGFLKNYSITSRSICNMLH